jgi:pilus assembly protein Flp/PilA
MMRLDQTCAPMLRRFAANDDGATAIEYALIAACISIAIIGSAQGVSQAIQDNFYNKVVGGLEDAGSGGDTD